MEKASQMNVNVLPITKERIKALATATFRGNGDVVDMAVSLAWSLFEEGDQRVAITPEGRQALRAVKEASNE